MLYFLVGELTKYIQSAILFLKCKFAKPVNVNIGFMSLTCGCIFKLYIVNEHFVDDTALTMFLKSLSYNVFEITA